MPFYRILPFLYNTEENLQRMKATLLINSSQTAFYLLPLIYDISARATVERNYRLFHCEGPPQIACYFSREAILQKILTVGQ